MDEKFLNTEYNAGEVFDLMKAMTASHSTGRDLTNTDTSGSALKVESLDPMLKILTSRDKHIVLWNQIPKDKAYNTVEEYNQLVDYGLDVGIFNDEGEAPQFTDSIYRRKAILVKYMGVAGEVTHPMQLVRLGSGVGNMLATEVQNKTQFLIRAMDKAIPTGNSDHVSMEFDGIFKQHYDGVVGSTGTLNTYFDDSVVIDARGAYLTDALVESAAHGVVNDNYGAVSSIMAPPVVFSDYVKQFHESKNIMVNNPIAGTTGAIMGQAVNQIQTQFGMIDVNNDIFFDYKTKKKYNGAATSSKAPAACVAGGAPVAAVTDTSNMFGTTYAGDYFYAVTAKNRYGESAMTILSTSAVTVASTESVDLQWTQSGGSYAAESFVVYRTEKGATPYTTADFYPIFTITVAELAAGYDGAAATKVRDRNRFISNTYSAIVYDNSIDVWAFKQLAPIMRMDLARVAPSFRFMVLCYGSPVLYAPKKMARIVNIGKRGL